ncbi:PaaI family thioesterase [Sphingosinicellaceae bacterium]|nr:PaaI family thioesterase [Sphingosinicellaceae bacterium]
MTGDDQAPNVEHFRALERLYAGAPINRAFASTLTVTGPGTTRIEMNATPEHFHAAGAVHGTLYFKVLDDAAFYAANSLVPEVFMLTTAFNILMSRPLREGPIVAEGRWVSGARRVLIAESWLTDASGEEVGRGTGTFMRSRIPLASLADYT